MKTIKRPLAIALTGLLFAGLTLTGCGQGNQGSTASVAPSTPAPAPTAAEATDVPDTDPALAKYYEQKVKWQKCDGKYECAKVQVPLDYSQPDGKTIKLAVMKLPAKKKSIGAMFVNPGGPGSSGIEFMASVPAFLSRSVLDSYDIIGFDPRGVGKSSPVVCRSDAEIDYDRNLYFDLETPEGMAGYEQYSRDFAQKCLDKNDRDLLQNIDTHSAALDLDVLRQAAGNDELFNYIGYSYGTHLGATYTELFPKRVGRVVLDGAMNPANTLQENSEGQGVSFELALREYVQYCLDGSKCPLTGSVDSGMRQIRSFLERADANPLTTQDEERPLTRSLATTGVFGPLYSRSSWPTLTEGLNMAMKENDGSTLLAIADAYSSREADGHYSTNTNDAFLLISYADYNPVFSKEEMTTRCDELKQKSPVLGGEFCYGELSRTLWPLESKHPQHTMDVTGASPLLIIGTTIDPATPYEDAVALSKQLKSSRLLTWNATNHTAYGSGSKCIAKEVDTYLLTGKLPAEGKKCD